MQGTGFGLKSLGGAQQGLGPQTRLRKTRESFARLCLQTLVSRISSMSPLKGPGILEQIALAQHPQTKKPAALSEKRLCEMRRLDPARDLHGAPHGGRLHTRAGLRDAGLCMMSFSAPSCCWPEAL